MIDKLVKDIGIADITRLIGTAYESHTLEFKAEVNISHLSDRKEFLADISSFSNASGGDILFGVTATKGLATALPGVTTSDPDGLCLQMENLIRDGITKRIAFHIRFFPLASDRYIYLLRVEEGALKPHQVALGGSGRFYSRGNSGKFIMSPEEVRQAVLSTDREQQRVEEWLQVAQARLKERETPVPLSPNLLIALFLIPYPAGEGGTPSFLASSEAPLLSPLGGGSRSPAFNDEGLLSFTGIKPGVKDAYLQLYLNGILETVNGDYGYPYTADKNIPVSGVANYEKGVVQTATDYVCFLRHNGGRLPLHLSVSLIGCKGYFVAWDKMFHSPIYPKATIKQEDISSTILRITDWDTDLAALLKPFFDRIWNACGRPRSLNYTETGIWQPLK